MSRHREITKDHEQTKRTEQAESIIREEEDKLQNTLPKGLKLRVMKILPDGRDHFQRYFGLPEEHIKDSFDLRFDADGEPYGSWWLLSDKGGVIRHRFQWLKPDSFDLREIIIF